MFNYFLFGAMFVSGVIGSVSEQKKAEKAACKSQTHGQTMNGSIAAYQAAASSICCKLKKTDESIIENLAKIRGEINNSVQAIKQLVIEYNDARRTQVIISVIVILCIFIMLLIKYFLSQSKDAYIMGSLRELNNRGQLHKILGKTNHKPVSTHKGGTASHHKKK